MVAAHVLLRGLPGVGKSTFGKLLQDKFPKSQYISSGQLLRRHNDKHIQSILSNGELVDSNLIMDIMKDEVSKFSDCSFVILDGFPRKLVEMKQWITSTQLPSLVVYLHLPVDRLVKRIMHRQTCMNCGAVYNAYSDDSMRAIVPRFADVCDICNASSLINRPEDSELIVRRRLACSTTEEEPIIRYLEHEIGPSRFVHIDGSSIETISTAIQQIRF